MWNSIAGRVWKEGGEAVLYLVFGVCILVGLWGGYRVWCERYGEVPRRGSKVYGRCAMCVDVLAMESASDVA